MAAQTATVPAAHFQTPSAGPLLICLGNPTASLLTLRRHGRKHFDFVPETYCLPNDLPLLKRAWDTAKPKTKWILKPNASARGIGIKVINQWSQIPKRKSVLVQQYLHNPLLVNGTKFDLRIYAYVTSFDPLRIYICKEGLARFATQKYTNKSSKISNRYMHLTNYSVNKKSAAFVESSEWPEMPWLLPSGFAFES